MTHYVRIQNTEFRIQKIESKNQYSGFWILAPGFCDKI
jgi:hypothetical protein